MRVFERDALDDLTLPETSSTSHNRGFDLRELRQVPSALLATILSTNIREVEIARLEKQIAELRTPPSTGIERVDREYTAVKAVRAEALERTLADGSSRWVPATDAAKMLTTLEPKKAAEILTAITPESAAMFWIVRALGETPAEFARILKQYTFLSDRLESPATLGGRMLRHLDPEPRRAVLTELRIRAPHFARELAPRG